MRRAGGGGDIKEGGKEGRGGRLGGGAGGGWTMRQQSGSGSIGGEAVGREGEYDNNGEILFGFRGSRCHGDCDYIQQSSVSFICPGLYPCPPGLCSPHPYPPVPVSTNYTASLGGNVTVPGIVWGSQGNENVRRGGASRPIRIG